MVSGGDDDIPLAEAALLIAAEEYPGLAVSDYLAKLDAFAEAVRPRIASSASALDAIEALNETLFHELGFQGDTENYYDPRNSLLNQVIDRRKGIPITLSIVYVEVARRANLAMAPVGLPGHFLVKHLLVKHLLIKHQGEAGELLIDPFNGGRIMTEPEVAQLLRSVTDGRLTLSPEHLAESSNKQILTRILANLYGVYARGMDYDRAAAVVDRMLLIAPDTPVYFRDRGFLFAAMRKTPEAVADLERYLKLAPEADDADSVRARIREIRQLHAGLN